MQAIGLGLAVGIFLGAAAGEGGKLQRFQSEYIAMGTTTVIVLYASDAATANRAFQAAFERLTFVDRTMSDYDSDSEVMRLCQAAPTAAPVPVSRELCEVLAFAQDLSRRTDGAFDVTVGPLTRLWRRARRRAELPDAGQLQAARNAVGYQHLVVHAEQGTVELRRPGMRIDLGGIAQGYASDLALAALRAQGIHRALVNVSGDINVADPPPGESGWTIGIAPLQPDAPPSHLLSLNNACVTTSGDAFQFVEIAGQRYSHVLDPRTGVGLTQHSSTSVVAKTGVAADALATAVGVLGVEQGLRLIADTPGTAALIVRQVDGQVTTHQSPNFSAYLKR